MSDARLVRAREALVAELMGRATQGAKLGLDRVRAALSQLQSPQDELVVVHVAGTNGKGSSCAMLEAIARRAGLRVGFYSSPHLARLNERIRIDGAPIDDVELVEALGRALDPALPPVSFFEALTIAALVAMRSASVDLAILEVGLGGRLDATNVIERPAATAITSIGRDHAQFLGDDLASIAREKAGICKPATPLVLGPLEPEPLAAVAEVARARGSAPVWRVATTPADELSCLERHGHAPIAVGPLSSEGTDAPTLRIALPGGPVLHASPSLAGEHQHHNAGVAAALAWLLSRRWPALDATAITEGLARAVWPGRFETLMHEQVEVVLDCAHNLEATTQLRRALEALKAKRTLLVFGTMEDKPWRAMLAEMAPLADERFYCEPLTKLVGRGPAAPSELRAVAPGHALRTPEQALAAALAAARPGDRLVVTGSIFLVGAVRARLLKLPRDVVVPL